MKSVLRKCSIAVIIVLSLIFSSCVNQNALEFYDAESVIINGEETDHLHVQINRKKVAHVPIIALLTELGFEVVWKDASTAVVSILEKEYVISLVEKAILSTDREDGFNYLTAAPGTQYYYCEAVENDIVVDGTTIRSFFFLIDYPYSISINVDYKKMTVSIETPNLTT